jgi:hypothetical protein
LGNDFLKRLAEARVPELTRLPHALDPEIGFRVRSRFIFKDFHRDCPTGISTAMAC